MKSKRYQDQREAKLVKSLPRDLVTPCYIECVLMANGEIIHLGKAVSTFEKSKGFIIKRDSY